MFEGWIQSISSLERTDSIDPECICPDDALDQSNGCDAKALFKVLQGLPGFTPPEGLCLDLQRVASGFAAEQAAVKGSLIEVTFRHQAGMDTSKVPLDAAVLATTRSELGLGKAALVDVYFGSVPVTTEEVTFAAMGAEDGSHITVTNARVDHAWLFTFIIQ